VEDLHRILADIDDTGSLLQKRQVVFADAMQLAARTGALGRRAQLEGGIDPPESFGDRLDPAGVGDRDKKKPRALLKDVFRRASLTPLAG
jgi:hypothetical protein